jgi:hypothetical protein
MSGLLQSLAQVDIRLHITPGTKRRYENSHILTPNIFIIYIRSIYIFIGLSRVKEGNYGIGEGNVE